jgi:hypothetical protein
MHTRLRLLQGATALLYFGPLLAGLGGFGWGVVPVFAAIFLLWLVILRPHLWPRFWADWGRPEALTPLAAQAAVQVLLVTLCFGIGRGIGGVLGALPPFPLMLPVAVSFLSIPLCRMIGRPAAGVAFDDLLDEAVLSISPLRAEVAPEARRLRGAVAARLVVELGHLPTDCPDETLVAHLVAMATQAAPEDLRVALMDPIYDGTAGAVHWRAAVLHATDAGVVRHLAGSTYAAVLFRELRDVPLLQLFARRCRAMLAEAPDTAADCPDLAEVQAMARAKPAAAAALEDLAAALGGALPGAA